MVEVSKIGKETYRKSWFVERYGLRSKPLTERQMVGASDAGVRAFLTGCTTAGPTDWTFSPYLVDPIYLCICPSLSI